MMKKVVVGDNARQDAHNLDESTDRWKIRRQVQEFDYTPTAISDSTVARNPSEVNYFEQHRQRRSANTLRAHDNDLDIFSEYLRGEYKRDFDLTNNPQQWASISQNDVDLFMKQALQDSYTFNTINRRLATIKLYCKLAYRQSIIDADTYLKIQAIQIMGGRERNAINKKRIANGKDTRRFRGDKPAKKANPISIPVDLVSKLKHLHDDSPIGHRDRLVMCLLLDLGLRAGELSRLRAWNINYADRTVAIYRPSFGEYHTLKLTDDIINALDSYITVADGFSFNFAPLIRQIKKNGEFIDGSLSVRSISRIVNNVGMRLGVDDLSAEDCRHSWAVRAMNDGTPLHILMQIGGWKQVQSLIEYISA